MGDSLAADRVIDMHDNGGFHTMYRLRMDGKFGAFDARYGYYLIDKDSPDARVLDWEEVGNDDNVWANLNYKNRVKPFVEFPQHEFERVLWLKNKPDFQGSIGMGSSRLASRGGFPRPGIQNGHQVP